MKIRNAIISLAAVSILFTACGGGGGGGTAPDNGSQNQGDLKINTKTTYDVLAGKTMYVTVLTGNDFINTNDATSYYVYSVVDKGTATFAKFDVKNYGILKYTNSGTSEKIKISIKDSRSGKVVETDLNFNVVAESEASEMKILQTGQEDGDAGEARDFTRETTPTSDVIDNVNNITWEDDYSDFGNFKAGDKTFTEAKKVCQNAGFRLPTEEELYTTVYYKSDRYQSATVAENMLDDAFKARESYFWASSGRAISYANGGFTTGEKARFRCVKSGAINVDKHLMYTDENEVTHDLSTKLAWSASGVDRYTYAEAKAYCEAKAGGWKLPTINQLRSIIDNGVISGAVIGSNGTLLSSTKVISNGLPYYLYVVPSAADGRIKYRTETAAEADTHTITCVKPDN